MRLYTITILVLIVGFNTLLGAVETKENLITIVSEKDATGEVKKIYDDIQKTFGMVPNAMKHQSISPDILKNSWEFVKLTLSYKDFSPKLSTMIRLLVGGQKECHYCVGVNEGMLINMFKLSMKEVDALEKDPKSAPLNNKEKSMLLFVLKATKNAQSVTKSDIDELKKLGWSERSIFEGVKLGATVVAFTITLDTFKVAKD